MLEHMISLSDAASAAVSTAENTGTVLEKLGLGASVTVMGLAIVFLGLISLIIITVVYPKITRALISRSSARKEKAKIDDTKPKKPVAVQKTAAPAVVVKPAEDDALIAVITGAIAASLGTSANGVVV